MHTMNGIPDAMLEQVLRDIPLDGSRLVSKKQNPVDKTWTIVIDRGSDLATDDSTQLRNESEDVPEPEAAGTDIRGSQDSDVAAEFSELSETDALILSEADLIALWRRSAFPIPDKTAIVFGIRGCLPVDYGGTPMAQSHQISLTPVNYRTMNCTLGVWIPGQGFSLYPGSTVPYGPWVASGTRSEGRGVNQLGRGRYRKYVPGWHKRSEGTNGHWALLQECPITLQRTADDDDFDLADRWEAGRIAGDNIHCAFNMGPGAAIPSSKYSSLGCQVIAGTVKKGVPGSETGPWKRFISNFPKDTAAQVEYVLFDGLEVQQMIRSRCQGKTIILRVGSNGPHVEELKRRLSSVIGRSLGSSAEFDVETFQAVIDFQTNTFGTNSDDGVVGEETANKLGFSLPIFDYRDAVGGGRGDAGVRTGAEPAIEVEHIVNVGGVSLTAEDFKTFAPPPGGSKAIYMTYVNAFVSEKGQRILSEYGISAKPIRVAHFFGQAAHETGLFRLLRESLTYTTVEAIRNAWPSRAARHPDQWIKDHLLRNPEFLGDWAYGDRMGNDKPGDGNRYRGGGVFQLTGKDAYRSVSKLLEATGGGHDLVADPSLIEDPYISLIAACAEWKDFGGNALADNDEGRRISRGINRGDTRSLHAAIGEDDRLELISAVKKVVARRG
ncbi:peptidoglycan-binding protein [Rhizobium ruizarguesonis]